MLETLLPFGSKLNAIKRKLSGRVFEVSHKLTKEKYSSHQTQKGEQVAGDTFFMHLSNISYITT